MMMNEIKKIKKLGNLFCLIIEYIILNDKKKN